MKITKRIFCYILVGFLTFGLTASSYYRSVHAMEWIGGALAFEEALKWLLACVGVTATAGMTDAYWDVYGDEFEAYAAQNGATQQEVTEWELKLCEGILDKGSQVWDRFLEWASSLVNSTSSSVPVVGASYHDTLVYINDFFGFNLVENNSYLNNNIYAFLVLKNNTNNYYYIYMFNTNNNLQNLITNRNGTLHCNYNRSNSYIAYYNIPANGSGTSSQGIVNSSFTLYNKTTGDNYISSNVPYATDSNYNLYSVPFGESSGTVADENFEASWSQDIENTDVISSSVPDEADEEVDLHYPGVSDSDNTASKDAYDEIIDAINDGTITQEDGLERIQELLKVIVYDTVTDDVLPRQEDPDTGENKKKEEAIQENKDNMGFTLGGLEAVFPFCIPFDIYAFMTLLVSDPVAPEFDYPIQSVNGEVEEIHIDLSPFEPVAVVVRYIFDFLFIIGLGILTRSLIGGGGSD